MSRSAVRLHVASSGRGTPVAVLHGFTGSGESMAEVAAALDAHHRVLCVDLVGHGRSPAPDDPAEYSMRRCVAQVVDALDRANAARVHLLGYSMGGRTALALAAWHPERVRSALLVGASAGIADPAARAARIRQDEVLAERIETEGIERFVDAWMALPLFASQQRLGPARLAAARAQRLRNRPAALAHSLRGMGSGAQPPLHDALANLRPPLLLAHGAEDAKFASIARELAGLTPHARVAEVAGAGHACHLEAPEAFAKLALEFFAAYEADDG